MTTTYGNNDRLTEIINQCQEPRRVLALLALIVKPCLNQNDNAREEVQISVGDVFTRLGDTKAD